MRVGSHNLIRGSLAAALALAAFAAPASAQTGAVAPPPETAPAPPTTSGATAKLLKSGRAVAPASAPIQVQNAINAGNRIRKKPYIYGGGHKSFNAKGYDCSGAVSYVLNAAGVLEDPMPSGSFMKWGEPGHGTWITVYAHGGHMYAVIAGLRWDTSAAGDRFNRGSGPRWRAAKRSAKGFRIRHPTGL